MLVVLWGTHTKKNTRARARSRLSMKLTPWQSPFRGAGVSFQRERIHTRMRAHSLCISQTSICVYIQHKKHTHRNACAQSPMYTYTPTHARARVHACMHICVCVWACVRVGGWVGVCTRVCVRTLCVLTPHMCARLCACMRV